MLPSNHRKNILLEIAYEVFNHNGRDNRLKFLLSNITILFLFIFSISFIKAVSDFGESIGSSYINNICMGFTGILFIVLIIYSIISTIRRFHDLNMSGMRIFFNIIPIYNIYLFFILYFKKGVGGPNDYGDDPLKNIGSSEASMLKAIFFAVMFIFLGGTFIQCLLLVIFPTLRDNIAVIEFEKQIIDSILTIIIVYFTSKIAKYKVCLTGFLSGFLYICIGTIFVLPNIKLNQDSLYLLLQNITLFSVCGFFGGYLYYLKHKERKNITAPYDQMFTPGE